MTLSKDDVRQHLRFLLHATDDLGVRLVESGFDETEVKKWMFHVREILERCENIQLGVVDTYTSADLQQVPNQLMMFVGNLYAQIPILEHHVERLDEHLEKFMPPNADDLDDSESDDDPVT